MNKDELQIILESANIPSELYNITERGRDDERFCLIHDKEQWEVFFKERGVKTIDKIFTTESEACKFIYEQFDLLVVKKDAAVQITNEVGSFFKGHNIMEYKSPDDHLDIDAFYKAGAYASLYKSYGKTSDEIKADDITVSLMREKKPERLFRYFKEHGYSVSNPYKGIYYIEGKVLFPTQLIVTNCCSANYMMLH